MEAGGPRLLCFEEQPACLVARRLCRPRIGIRSRKLRSVLLLDILELKHTTPHLLLYPLAELLFEL